MIALLYAALGGLGRRVAGGAFQQWTNIDVGDYPARLFFGLTLAACMWIAGSSFLQGFYTIFAVFLGCSIPNDFKLTVAGRKIEFGSIALGHGTSPYWRDAVGLTLHGFLGMLLPAVIVYFMGHDWPLLLLAGLLIVPAYDLGWRIAGPAGVKWMPPGLRGGTEFGELFWGALCGLAAGVSA